MDVLENRDFDISTLEGKRAFVTNLVCYYLICEGIFFWTSFVLLASVFKQGKLLGLHSQIKYTLKDETNHLNFGIYVLNEIRHVTIPRSLVKHLRRLWLILSKRRFPWRLSTLEMPSPNQ